MKSIHLKTTETAEARTSAKRVRLGRALLVAALGFCSAEMARGDDSSRVSKLENENEALKKRLEALETMAQKEGILKAGADSPKFVSSLSEITLTGFAQASYFYNTQTPADRNSDGYLWNTTHNSFSLNKVKLTLASKPVERSGEEWDAAFRTSLMWGEDSPVLNTGSPRAGLEAIREAYVELNVPIGTGLNVRAGQLISLLNFESGDGGAVNPNFSQGYQWFFTGNGPSAGVQVGYTFTDWLDVKARVQNGLYQGPIDSNSAKTALGSIGLKPNDKLWVNLIGFGGEESATLTVQGGSVLAGYKVTDKLNVGTELDYFNFDPKSGNSSDLFSGGAWIWYDFSAKYGIAFRGEYLHDPDGGGLKGINLPGRTSSAIISSDVDGDLASLTLTFNWRPTPAIRIMPEIRYDHTSYKGGLDGEKDRIIVGLGASYLF